MNKNKIVSLIIVGLSFLLTAGCTSKKEQLTASTLTIAVEPGSIAALSAGNSVQLTAICKSAKSDNVDIAPTWSVENNLGTFNPATGKTTVFTAGSVNNTGKIYASYADVRSAGVNVTVGSGGGNDGGTSPGVLFADAGMATDLAPVSGTDMLHYFDGGDGSQDSAPWRIDVQNEPSGCTVDSQKSMKITYTDVADDECYGGFYLAFSSPKDMSAYSKLTFYAKGTDGNESFEIKIHNSSDADWGVNETLTTTSWQKIEIPLSSFTGVPLSQIDQPFIIAFKHTLTGKNATIYIDYIKYE